MSDAVSRLKLLEEGAEARVANKPRTSCPYQNGMEQKWWLKGYDSPHLPSSPIVKATAKDKSSYH